MRHYSLLFLALTGILLQAQVPLTAIGTPSTQDFNTLANSGTSSAVPAGWAFLETGANANATYSAGTGSSNAGDTYSFGAAAAADRALGGLLSGSLVPTIGASFTNNTGSTITSLAIAYMGETWRIGTASRSDRLEFQYSLNATALNNGSWTSVTSLDYTNAGAASTGAVDGNANRTPVSFTITGLNIAPGATFFIRWNDFNASGADDGMGIDDFSLTPQGTASTTPSLSINDVSLNEGNTGTTSFNFTVSLSAPAPAGGVTFNIATADNTATAPSDYTAQTLTAQTIAQGNTTYSFTVLVNGDTVVEPNETFFVNVTNVNGATVGDGQGQGTILNDDIPPPTLTAINAIQGTGISSPLLGQTVTAQGVVTALTSNGYFLQTPDAAIDADPNTSEGVFVFTNTTPTVAVGQLVNSTGSVIEFRPSTDPNSRPITEISQTSVAVVSSGNPLPVAVTLPALTATGGVDQYERFEGMRVEAGSLTVVAPTDGTVNEPNATAASTGVLYTVFPGVAMPFREAGIETLDQGAFTCAAGSGCALPTFDANPERLRLDTDAVTGQTAVNVNTGATLSNVIGVMHYGFRAYSLLTTAAPIISGTPVTATAASVAPAGLITVAAMNVERLYDTIDDPNSDVVVTSTALNGRLNKISLAIRNLLRTPDVIAFSEVEKLSVLQALADKINADAVAASQPNPLYQAYLVEGNDIGGIDVGFLTKSTVSVVSTTQLGSALTFTNPCSGAAELLNDRPTFRLRGTANGMAFTVFVNHLRSLNGIGDLAPCAGNGFSSTAGGRVRAKRAAQANYVAGLVQDELTANPAAKIMLVGDFNAFEVNDGFVDIINTIMGTPPASTQVATSTQDPTYANMTNLLSLLPTPQRYSYVFDGNHQTLDHAILNPAAMSQYVGGGYARVNADFSEASFRGNFSTPERYSDHDPVYVRLSTGTNVTPQVTVTRGVIGFNRATRLYQMPVILTNTSASTITGPMQMAITNMTEAATLTNAASFTPGGAVYTDLPPSLAPGESATVVLTFSLPSSMPVNFTVSLFRN